MKRLAERARIVAQVRRFFEARGFDEVSTALMVASPGLELHLDAFEVAGGDRGQPRWLQTSPEYQMKRLLAEGWERIYQVAPCFRRGESGVHHNAEFTLLEWYRASAGVEDVMRDTEQLVAAVSSGDARHGGRKPGEVRLGDRIVDVRPPFERISVCDAFARFAGWRTEETLAAAAENEDAYFRALVEKVEPAIGRFDRAIFLVDYPATQASLAQKKPGDARFAERFELYVGGIELCNGFGELVDPVEQRTRFERDRADRVSRGMPVYPIDERFLDALSRVPPSAGNALGLDRLVALACGTDVIAEVIAFADDEV